MQQKSNSFTDKFIAWMLEHIGSGTYGDTLRLLAGGKNAANQIEFISKYGTASPLLISREEENTFEKTMKDTLKKVEEMDTQYFSQNEDWNEDSK